VATTTRTVGRRLRKFEGEFLTYQKNVQFSLRRASKFKHLSTPSRLDLCDSTSRLDIPLPPQFYLSPRHSPSPAMTSSCLDLYLPPRPPSLIAISPRLSPVGDDMDKCPVAHGDVAPVVCVSSLLLWLVGLQVQPNLWLLFAWL
jgi:hypothetical protein